MPIQFELVTVRGLVDRGAVIVELTFTAAGDRVFNVAINGTSVLSNFDIYAQVGENHALVEQFNATANSSGQIVIAFTQGYQANTNPAVASLSSLGQSGAMTTIAPDAPGAGPGLSVATGESLSLQVAWPDCTSGGPCGGAETFGSIGVFAVPSVL